MGFDDQTFEQLDRAAQAPPSPRGLTQLADAGIRDQGFGSTMDQVYGEGGLAALSGSWYTGQNRSGTQSGWSTDFYDKMVKQYDELVTNGGLGTQFERADATGIVTWDHDSTDGTRRFHFGDVYEDGAQVGNVFRMYDAPTANLLMGEVMFDSRKKADLFSEADPAAAVAAAVEEQRRVNNVEIPKAYGAQAFEADVTARAESFKDDGGEAKVTAAGAGGGAAIGAGVGAGIGAITGPGALLTGAIGAGVGAVVGGVGGWLNRDELLTASARAYETTALSNREQSPLATAGEALHSWGGVAMQASSPLTNIAKGGIDVAYGKGGDLESEYYRVDDTGRPTRPGWAKPLVLATSVGDGALQFGSPLARIVYMGEMGSVTLGGATQLAASGGRAFDPARGGYDQIFRDDQGNFSPLRGAAGIANVGIDAVQMGGMWGFARSISRERAALSEGRSLEAAGMRFATDEAGRITGRRFTLAVLAPSEQVAAVSALRTARVQALSEGRTVTADDIYRAATSMRTGSRRLKLALVNGFGEGYEEFAQGVLEPYSVDAPIDLAVAGDAFLMGAAGGLGMSLGATLRAPTAEQRLKAQGLWMETLRRGGVEPDEATFDRMWEQMTPTERRASVNRSAGDVQLTTEALDDLARGQAATMVSTSVDVAREVDARRSAFERALRRAGDRVDRYIVMSGRVDTLDGLRPEAITASAVTVAALLEDKLRGLGQQDKMLAAELAKLEVSDPRHVEYTALRQSISNVTAVGEVIAAQVARLLEKVYNETLPDAERESALREANRLLGDAYEMRFTGVIDGLSPEDAALAGAMFVTSLHSREPKLDAGSYLALLPQMDRELTFTRSDNLVQVNTDMLQAINGDFDGDKLHSEYALVLSEEKWRQARAGVFFTGAGRSVDIGNKALVGQMVRLLSVGLNDGDFDARNAVDSLMASLAKAYEMLMTPAQWASFRKDAEALLTAGEEDAVIGIVNALAARAAEKITRRGMTELRNEWLTASHLVRQTLQTYQRSVRAKRWDPGKMPLTNIPGRDIDTPEGTNARKARGVTVAHTMAVYMTGTSLFRKFQKIHYTWFNSGVLSSLGHEKADADEMAAFYELISRNAVAPEISRLTRDSSISGRVLRMLETIVDEAIDDLGLTDPTTAVTILANVKVKDVWWTSKGAYTDNKTLSLAQVLLKRALDAEREEYDRVWDSSPELQLKHAQLRVLTRPNSAEEPVNAERAFFEIFKALPFATSLRGVTGALAEHTTPEQKLRDYISEDAEGRRQLEREWTRVPEYLSRKETSNLPYSMTEMLSRKISPYHSMVDALIAVGRNELSFDPKVPAGSGRSAFTGRRAEISQRAEADLRTVHESIRAALFAKRGVSNAISKNRKITVELVRELMEENPQWGRALVSAVPDDALNSYYEERDGELFVASWLLEFFTIANTDEAVFHLWKNLTIARYSSTLMRSKQSDEEYAGRTYLDLSSRFQRLMYLMAREPGQPRLERLIRAMSTSKNLNEFFVWLNRTPGMHLPNEAPLLPFNDNVASFDPNTLAGMSGDSATQSINEALSELARTSKIVRETQDFRVSRNENDKPWIQSLRRALAGTGNHADDENLRRFEKLMQLNREMPRSFAPSSMLALVQGAMRGFDSNAHDKGKTIGWAAGMGEFQALMDAWGFLPHVERIFEQVTSISMSSLRTNLSDITRVPGRAMDDDGATVEWSGFTTEQMVNMLDNFDTAPFAYAMLVPLSLEVVNGRLVERTLFTPTLTHLLSENGEQDLPGNQLADLFELGSRSRSLHRAVTYVQMVDSRLRKLGGHFDVLRYVATLATARLSSLGQEATEDDLRRARDRAFMDTAKALQVLGSVLSSKDTADGKVLDEVRVRLVEELRQHRAGQAGLNTFIDTRDEIVKGFVESLRADVRSHFVELAAQIQAKDLPGEEELKQLQALSREEDYALSLYDNLEAADLLEDTVSQYMLTGDPKTDVGIQGKLVSFVLETTNFGHRAPDAFDLWSHIVNKAMDGKTPDPGFDWERLSRNVISVALADKLVNVASHVSIPELPAGDPTAAASRFYKYFDPSWSFVVNDLLAPTGPIAEAAVWLHNMAEQPRLTLGLDEIVEPLRSSIAATDSLGKWTPAFAEHLMEIQKQIDSAAGGPFIAAPGNGPKRMPALTMTTLRRDDLVPDPTKVTTVTVDGYMFGPTWNPFYEFPVTPAGHTAESAMQVAQLDNRFYQAVIIDGTRVPLDEGLGFAWYREDRPSGYRHVSLERLRQLVQNEAKRLGKPLRDVKVELQFIHPDSRPAGSEWMHNVYFDGMSHTVAPDMNDSLIATLWSDNGGLIGALTQQLIDSGKLGQLALPTHVGANEVELASIRADWDADHDLSKLLRRTTALLFETDPILLPEHYNAMFKQLSLHYLIVGVDDTGKPKAMTAEEYIARRAAGEDIDALLHGWRLVTLSPQVLRSMLGNAGGQGVIDLGDDEFLINVDSLPQYEGPTREDLERFGDGWLESRAVEDTSLRHVAAQRQQKVRTMLTDAERGARVKRVEFLTNESGRIHAVRAEKLDTGQAQSTLTHVLDLALGKLQLEKVSSFDFMADGLPFVPVDVMNADETSRLIQVLRSDVTVSSQARGWYVVDESHPPDYVGGTLTVQSLHQRVKPQHKVVLGDVAVLELRSFDKPDRSDEQMLKRLSETLQWLSNTGATIILAPDGGTKDLRHVAEQELRSQGYERVSGSAYRFAPVGVVGGTQDERLYESTVTETYKITPNRNVVTFVVDDTENPVGLTEGAAFSNPRSRKLLDRKPVNNLVPVARFSGYNVPVDINDDLGLYPQVLEHLKAVSARGSDGRRVLKEQAGPDAIGMSLDDALDRLWDRLTTRASMGLEVGDVLERGDIIPLVHSNGSIILHRMGFKALRIEDLQDKLDMEGLNVAIAVSEVDPFFNANSGVISKDTNRFGPGKMLTLDVEMQRYGDKLQLEWNGLKLIGIPATAELDKYLSVPVFSNGVGIDLMVDSTGADAKQAYSGRVRGYREALTFFQWSFLDDLAKFFFPDEPVSAKTRTTTKTLLRSFARQYSGYLPVPYAAALKRMQRSIRAVIQDSEMVGLDAGFMDRLDEETPEAAITWAVLTYLMTPGATLDNVLQSAGFSHPQANTDRVQVRTVPGLFADLLDTGFDSPLHRELINRFSHQLYRRGDSGMRLLKNWKVVISADDKSTLEGWLQFGEARSSGDNPVLDGQAFDPNEPAVVSPHNVLAAQQSIGALTSHVRTEAAMSYYRSFREGALPRVGDEGQTLWNMLTLMPRDKRSDVLPWRMETAREFEYRALARDRSIALHRPFEVEQLGDSAARYEELVSDILGRLNLSGTQRALVDSWVRSYAGRPYEVNDEGVDLSKMSGADIVAAAADILQNVKDHQLPVAGGFVPLLDVGHLMMLFRANRTREHGWAPDGAKPADWNSWVDVAFGTAWGMTEDSADPRPEPKFDAMYQTVLDGVMHGYQKATARTRDLPVSSSVLRQHQLMDQETEALHPSTNPDRSQLLGERSVFATGTNGLEEMLAADRIYGGDRGNPARRSILGRQSARIEKYRRENKIATPRHQRARGQREGGMTFLGHTTHTSKIFRMMLNLRVFMGMFNAVLWVMAPVEIFMRRSINTMATVLSGETLGRVGGVNVKLRDLIQDTRIDAVAQALGWSPTFTPESYAKVRNLTAALADSPTWKGRIYRELHYQHPVVPGIGRGERALEKAAKFAAVLNDPSWGMPPRAMARVYLEYAVSRVISDPTFTNVYSVETLINGLAENPDWLFENDIEAHHQAMARISQIRGLKPNLASLTIRSTTEALASNDRMMWNATGNMLKLFTVFQNFWSNSFLTMTGLGAAAEFAASYLDGRQKSKLMRRMQASLSGVPFEPEADEYYDMSEVIESLDLADAFIRGGITHTALFTFGLMAGGLGLSGEDDEERRRRRAAQLQGAGLIRDPRAMENDFRNRDAIYLDNLPLGAGIFFRIDPSDPNSREMAQMNWATRYFVSPILGFERFYETGDFNEVISGYSDALGAHPLINQQLWDSAMGDVSLLQLRAEAAANNQDYEGAGHSLITAVGVLERMLFENAMVNMVYSGSDTYDRDPYVLPKLDSDKIPQGDVKGQSVPTDVLVDVVNPDGSVTQAYAQRDPKSALLHSYTENRFTLALLGSIFSGKGTGSDLFRWNMVPKIREVKLDPTSDRQLRADILAAWQGANALSVQDEGPLARSLTEGEATQIIKRRYEDAGIWWDADTVEAQAKQLAAQSNMALLSTVNEATGVEEMTSEGRKALIRGLRLGTTVLSSASLRGVYMTLEQRNELRDALAVEITQEGVDLGLSTDAATWRMRRIVFGTGTEEGTPKLTDLIYTDQIPYSPVQRYNQLNTTYMIGPNGLPVATGFERDGWLGAAGLKPLQKFVPYSGPGLRLDGRGNVVDEVAQINTGMRSLERRPATWEIPSIEEITKDGLDAVKRAIESLDISPSSPTRPNYNGGVGWRNFGRRYGGGGGGGGGRSYGSGAYFQKLYALPGGIAPYSNSIPFINVSNPIIRRADVRRERVWSERGRLKQWQ